MFNPHYAICSIIILFFLTSLYVTRKNPPTRRNYAYIALLICSWAISITSLILSFVFNSSYFSVNTLHIVSVLYLICAYTIPVLFYFYAKAIALDESEKIPSKYKKTVLSFFIIELLLIITSFKIKLIYTISPEKMYKVEFGQIIPYFISTTILVYSLIALIKEFKILPKIKFFTMFSFFVLIGFSDIIEGFYPNVLMTCFASSIAMVLIYVNIQKPESFIDNVTECFNQSAFVIIADKAIRENKVFCIGVAIEDISFLSTSLSMKTINSLLRDIAKELKRCGKNLELFYLNQGRFCFVGKAPESENSEQEIIITRKYIDSITDKIMSLFKKTWKKENFEFTLFARIVTFIPDEIKNTDHVIDTIDTLINSNQYRSNYPVSSQRIDNKNKNRFFKLDSVIKNSLKQDLLSVYYQPIYSCAKKRITGSEALIRMKDENGNFISPEEFIPVAEKNGCIYRIGEFVFESVCKFLKKIDAEFYGIEKIDVNLSVMQCMQTSMATTLLSISEIYNTPLNLINFEITETASADYPEVLKQNMHKFADAGIELSLDDYGSGYANMNYMLLLPFKMIKIDKQIVWEAFANPKVSLVLAATITMIKSLGMSVLAEGVETKEQKEWLEEHGCDFLQGYYFSRPIPQDEYLEYLEKAICDNSEKYSDVLDYRKQKAKEDKLREEEKLEEEKLKLERLKNDGVSSLKIDEDHELIELIEEI